ncbi:MAG TPA: hypothetical protein VEY12_01905 [Thermoplasmata archaeon]|nr:hypothetical protein [Thermoplasmata archaeon]
MAAPEPHASRSTLEAALCAELRSQGVAHEHRSLHFRVRLASGEFAQYDPDLVARRGPILFLIEPLETADGQAPRWDLLAAFLDQHSPEIVLIVIAPGHELPDLPAASYDEAYAADDLPAIVRRIREQDPKGIVRPFPKPKP